MDVGTKDSAAMNLIPLRAMCEALHISRRSIQCYEKAGLLAPTGKNKYGHLLYGQEAVSRAAKIHFFQQLGFKLREIRDLIDAPNDVLREALGHQVKALEEEIDRLQSLLKEVDDLMGNLQDENLIDDKEVLEHGNECN